MEIFFLKSYETSIGISRTFYKKLTAPYSTCIEEVKSPEGYNSEFFKATFELLNSTSYRQKSWYVYP
jgi:hypothetical protein